MRAGQFIAPIIGLPCSIGKPVSRLSDKRSGYPVSMREKQRTEFAARLREARKHAGLTQPQLAQKVGISQGTLGEAETKAVGSAYTVQLALACGVRPEWLATGEGDMTERNALPFTDELRARLMQEPPEVLQRVENVIRATLGLLPLGYSELGTSVKGLDVMQPTVTTRMSQEPFSSDLFVPLGEVVEPGESERVPQPRSTQKPSGTRRPR